MSKQIRSSKFAASALTVITCVLGTLANAEPKGRPDISGEIKLEATTKQAKDPYQESQDKAAAFIADLSAAIQKAQKGETPAAAAPDQSALNYLTGLYLLCSVKEGVCPSVLQAIFESDLIKAKTSGTSECPSMDAFWKLYVENDLEARHKYLVKTGNLNATTDFRQNVRPKYVHCSDTLKSELNAGTGLDTAAFLKKRYADATYLAAATKVGDMLRTVKEAGVNVFVETGAQ